MASSASAPPLTAPATLVEPPVSFVVESYAGATPRPPPGAAELELLQCRWAGRILVWRVPCGHFYVGPHWYCSILMLAFIVWAGLLPTQPGDDAEYHLEKRLAVTAFCLFMFLRCALKSPGILEAAHAGEVVLLEAEGLSSSRGAQGALPMSRGRWCHHCRLHQTYGCRHCDFCQVCVEGHDHHCVWMGKCIGRDNLCAFYSFLVAGFASLAYIVILVQM